MKCDKAQNWLLKQQLVQLKCLQCFTYVGLRMLCVLS